MKTVVTLPKKSGRAKEECNCVLFLTSQVGQKNTAGGGGPLELLLSLLYSIPLALSPSWHSLCSWPTRGSQQGLGGHWMAPLSKCWHSYNLASPLLQGDPSKSKLLPILPCLEEALILWGAAWSPSWLGMPVGEEHGRACTCRTAWPHVPTGLLLHSCLHWKCQSDLPPVVFERSVPP